MNVFRQPTKKEANPLEGNLSSYKYLKTLSPLIAICSLLTTQTLTQANPIAHLDITLDGKKYPFVLVEDHLNGTVSYTINSKTETKPRGELPKEIQQLLPTAPRAQAAPERLSPEEIQRVKQQWSEWGKITKKPTKRNPASLDLLPKEALKPNPSLTDPTASAQIPILIEIISTIPNGTLVKRIPIPKNNPSLELLPFGLSEEIPYQTTLLIENLTGTKGQRKALNVTKAGEHILSGTKLKKFRLLEELKLPEMEDSPPPTKK